MSIMHSAGGPGKVAVASSSLFGAVSGSVVANVMVDGPITIRLVRLICASAANRSWCPRSERPAR